ncbi:MAG: CotH kinase family protein [Ignavibacteriae bacterium]|nr:CotH kinase family protein [Ignavibacteriota bacterium]
MKLIILFTFLFTSQFLVAQNIVINEIMASNDITIYDEDGDASDWIELYNNGLAQMNLEGYYLSDDSLNIEKWQFPNVVLDPGEYLLVFASDKDTIMNYFHTNFKISASGEQIFLSDSTGILVDQINLPNSFTDISYARLNDGSFPWVHQSPTPGLENTGIEIDLSLSTVSFSSPSGFYSSTISVELSAGSSNVYYTLDGSIPDTNSIKYVSPINISKTTVLRAISDNNVINKPFTQTYFINESTDLPVISLSADPFDLFDADSGIYTNYTKDWERAAHVEFFDDNKILGFSEDCGINIYGNQSATSTQKPIAVKFKKDYGVSKIDYPLFPDFPVTTFKSFVLRNSGNDFPYTHIRDAVMQELVKDLDIDYNEYRPAAAFINGEYWGIYNIREKINEHYVANRHGVDPDNIDMLENNMNVLHGDSLSYQRLIDYMSTNDMATDAAYTYLDSVVDLDECILYFAAQAYYDNMDWPGTNIKFWRERSETGKWRWILFGLDFGFGLYAHGPSEDHIQFMFSPVETRYSNQPWATLFQRKLIENPIIKNRFVNQIADLLNTNFKSTRVVGVINSLANHISSEITKHRNRWGLGGESLNKMTAFANERPAYLRTHVRNYFNAGLDGAITLNSSSGGEIQINTIKLAEKDLPWSGTYFVNVPIEIKAIPNKGYKFDGWTGVVESDDSELSLIVSRTTNLSASFSIDSSSANDIVINEINYNSSNNFDTGDWVELYNKTDASIDISGWYFSDSDDNHKFIFPSETIVNSKEYLVLVENDSAFTNRFPEVNNYLADLGFGFNGAGELLRLFNQENQIVDSLTYDDIAPWPIEADGAGSTLELIDAESDNSVGINWRASLEHGTPGKINTAVTNIDDNYDSAIPIKYELSQNYPNPFNPSTTINYSLPENNYITLKVYNLLGEEVRTLFEGVKQAGSYITTFDAANLSSGVYYYRLVAGEYSNTKKFILLK